MVALDRSARLREKDSTIEKGAPRLMGQSAGRTMISAMLKAAAKEKTRVRGSAGFFAPRTGETRPLSSTSQLGWTLCSYEIAVARLVGKYYPYGTDKGSNPASGEKFTGYQQDSETGLDYAINRFQQPGSGRFLTPDRMTGSASDPGSWNKYAYTRGDPVNRVDPGGTCDEPADDRSANVCAEGDPVAISEMCLDPSLRALNPVGAAMMCDGPDTQAQPQQGGGNPNGETPGGYQNVKSEIPRAIALALEVLKNNPNCMNVFGNGTDEDGNFVNAADVLQGIASGTAYGAITIGPLVSTLPNSVINAQTLNQLVTYAGIGDLYQITINDLPGSSFLPTAATNIFGNAGITQAVTILHELGHIMHWLYGDGLPDDNSSTAGGFNQSVLNTQTIQKNCFPGVI